MLSIGSLFSGIGGLELGLEMAGLGPVQWQVEINPHARAVLAAHWPQVVRHDDVRAVGAANLATVDLICGGFPCQDVSSAGKRAGLGGTRSGLWFEFRRIVSEIRPMWVVVENVASGARAWVDPVSDGLAELGYAVLPVPLAAADVGAPHERARVFLVAAHAERGAVRIEPGRGEWQDGPGARVARDDGAHGKAAANAVRTRRKGHRAESHALGLGPMPSHWRSPIPDVLRVADGFCSRLDAARPRIRALGNAVVPQCAEVVGHVIRQLMEPPAP